MIFILRFFQVDIRNQRSKLHWYSKSWLPCCKFEIFAFLTRNFDENFTKKKIFFMGGWFYGYKCSFVRWFRIFIWQSRKINITWLMVDFRLFQFGRSFSIHYYTSRKHMWIKIFHFLIRKWPELFIKIIENFLTDAQNCQKLPFSNFSFRKFGKNSFFGMRGSFFF